MANIKSTKRAIITSVFSLFICVAMLIGTTYAWFTDEVTSANNIIQSGTLDIGMYYSNDGVDYKNVEDDNTAPAFSYQYWEPGYTEVKYVKIVNKGTLAFKFQLNIVPNVTPAAGEPNLADVIDVYLFDANATIDRAAIAAATPVGTLSDLIAENDGAAHGVLLPDPSVASTDVNADQAPAGEIVYCIVLKMREDAGNDYQNLSVGEGFALQLLATQYTWENDSFDHLYDDNAEYDGTPAATVIPTTGKWIDLYGGDRVWANTTLQFKPNETEEEALNGSYGLYHADFVVYADKDIPADSIILPGYYKEYCQYINDNWVGLSSSEVIPAGTQIRLVELLGVTVNYSEICKYGNDGTGFLCGISAVANDDGTYIAAGTTITVELRIYHVGEQGDCAIGGGCKHPNLECEKGDYTVIGTYKYTIPETTADRQPDNNTANP